MQKQDGRTALMCYEPKRSQGSGAAAGERRERGYAREGRRTALDAGEPETLKELAALMREKGASVDMQREDGWTGPMMAGASGKGSGGDAAGDGRERGYAKRTAGQR